MLVPTSGEPLRECAISGKVAMAEMLLAHGANPNTNVYAATSAMYEAYKTRDEAMMALLERHGGRLTAVAAAELGLVEHAERLLAEAAEGRTPEGITGPESSVAQDLLWGAIESPSPEIVMLALRATGWPREDPRWHGILENGLYLRPDSDRTRHLDGFGWCWIAATRTCAASEERRSSMTSRRPGAASRPAIGLPTRRCSSIAASASTLVTICSRARRSDGPAAGGELEW
jgi:hypothetical protein